MHRLHSIRALQVASVLFVATAAAITTISAVSGGAMSSGVVILVTLWIVCAGATWWVVRKVADAWVRRFGKVKRGFDFVARDRYSVAVVKRLPAGERLVNFVPAYRAAQMESRLSRSDDHEVRFYGIALTTVGLRWVTYARDSADPHRFGEVIVSEGTIRLSDITRVQVGQVICDDLVAVIDGFGRRFNSPLPGVSSFNRLCITTLTVAMHDGKAITLHSPYNEMQLLVINLNAMRSGDFLAARSTTASDGLERLHLLVNEGLLTQDEFDRLKNGFVGTTTEQVESDTARIRELHSLLIDGILTDSEFRQKKWDILSRVH